MVNRQLPLYTPNYGYAHFVNTIPTNTRCLYPTNQLRYTQL